MLELVDGDVGGEVVDAVERLVGGEGVPLGGGDPDQQRARETGPGRHGDRIHVCQAHARLVQGALHRWHHGLQMGAARYLGHYAAEPGMLRDAGSYRVGQQLMSANQADAGLVAGRLDAEYQGLTVIGCFTVFAHVPDTVLERDSGCHLRTHRSHGRWPA